MCLAVRCILWFLFRKVKKLVGNRKIDSVAYMEVPFSNLLKGFR